MKKMWAVFVGIGLLLLGSLCGCVQVKAEEPAGIPGKTMEISFITIGKGDAFLLKMPEGSYYMYDTGKKEDFEQIQKVLEQKKVTSLKGIFLSHGHKGHAGKFLPHDRRYGIWRRGCLFKKWRSLQNRYFKAWASRGKRCHIGGILRKSKAWLWLDHWKRGGKS